MDMNVWFDIQHLAEMGIIVKSEKMYTENIKVKEDGVIKVSLTPRKFSKDVGEIGWYKLSNEEDSQYRKIDFVGNIAYVERLKIGDSIIVRYPNEKGAIFYSLVPD